MSSFSVRRFLLVAGLLLAIAGTLEIGARVLDRLRGSPWDSEKSHAATQRLCDVLALEESKGPETGQREPATPEDRILQPYTAWEFQSTQMRIGGDVEYYRRAGRDTFDVCILGGAAAQSFADSGSARLVEALQRNPRLDGREVRIHDYACRGYKQPQMSKLLGWLLALGHQPDAVIEIDGIDEAELAWRNALAGTHPSYPSVSHWTDVLGEMRSDWSLIDHLHEVHELRGRARAFGEWFLDSKLWRSCFLDHLGSMRLRALEGDHRSAAKRLEDYVSSRPNSADLEGPKFSHRRSDVVDEIVDCWVRASKSMHGMCAARGILFLQVLQPIPRTSALEVPSDVQVESRERIYPRLLDAGKKLRAQGAPILDASDGIRVGDPRATPAQADLALADAVAVALFEATKR